MLECGEMNNILSLWTAFRYLCSGLYFLLYIASFSANHIASAVFLDVGEIKGLLNQAGIHWGTNKSYYNHSCAANCALPSLEVQIELCSFCETNVSTQIYDANDLFIIVIEWLCIVALSQFLKMMINIILSNNKLWKIVCKKVKTFILGLMDFYAKSSIFKSIWTKNSKKALTFFPHKNTSWTKIISKLMEKHEF